MEKTSKFIYFVICYVFFIFTDLYLSNILVDKLIHGYRLSNPVFSLNYIKNTGAAFSILQNSRELLIILSMIALVLLALHVIHNLKSISLKSCFFIALLSAGIAGNLHERIIYGYVRDYFQLNFINFPVFNISDILINVGVIALIHYDINKENKMIIYIDENDENKRLDSYLSEITPDLSRSKIQNFIKSGNVKINDSIKSLHIF